MTEPPRPKTTLKSGLYKSDLEVFKRLHDEGTLNAEQTLRMIFTDAGLIERSAKSLAMADLVRKVSDGDLPVEALLATIDADVTDVVPDLRLAVTRSAGGDRAVLVFIDTEFEPDGSGKVPGLRVLLNDDEIYVGKAYEYGDNHEAAAKKFGVRLDEIAYTGKEGKVR
jgi:hypothetical protein